MWHAPDDVEAVQRSLADVKAVICTGSLGAVPAAAASLKLPHLVLLASAGTPCQQAPELSVVVVLGHDDALSALLISVRKRITWLNFFT